MELSKRLPKSFFEKIRPKAPKESAKEVIPVDWSEEVLKGNKKVIVKLPKEKKQ